MMTNKKIAVVLYRYPLSISTMIIAAIALLSQHNKVDVFLDDKQRLTFKCDPWLQALIVPGTKNPFAIFLRKATNKLRILFFSAFGRFYSFSWESINFDLVRFSKALRGQFSKNQYDIVIAIEAKGLIAVDRAEVFKGDLIYFDMELLDWSPKHWAHMDKVELKKRQFAALQKVNHVMITSPKRAEIFAQMNKFNPERISVLPVVPLKRKVLQRSRYFRDKFKIPEHQVIVLYAGNFSAWAQCLEIIESMDNWPKEAVLVMHTGYGKQVKNLDYFKAMEKKASGRQVYFSLEPMLYQDITEAMTSADIGLAFYENLDANFYEICFSSNKMAEYLASGLSVITSPFEGLKEFVEGHGIGRSVDCADIGKAVQDIIQKERVYRENVKKCVEKFFIFEDYFSKAWLRYEKYAGLSQTSPH
ncbi:MAG: hypothetical protein HQL13_00590 [Candidatus Omnitrophica bacterium]|nr:hypothetical protein [Candidatus Omnitrophota bacterium]